jgi:hypothetical protein
VDIQALALANVRASIGSQVEHSLLANLPNGLVDSLDVVGDSSDILNRA